MSPAVYSGGASSAESNFRELDDVFLQTQTRIWLGEILHRRLDEKLSISDLLADGELLFEVSNVVWNILLAKCVELRHLKAHRCKPVSSGKGSGRYLPYSYVDSFFKVCKVLGMNGIDLFSPSDVVEKRNVRKVCICIRSLSKKARSKQLNVPDFDVVTNTVCMPTDMVGCIRRSLEQSQWSSTSSSSYSSYKDSKRNYKQNSATTCDRNYESCSEESDEVQSNYSNDQFCNSYGNNSEDRGTSNLDKENSPGVSSVAANYTPVQSMRQARDLDEFESGQYKSTCLGEPEPVSLGPRYLKNEHPLDSMSSSRTSCIRPRKELCDQLLPVNNWSKNSYKSGPLDLVNIDSHFHNDESILGAFMDENRAERSCMTHHLELETFIPTLFDEDETVFDLFVGSDSHGSSVSHRVVHQNGIRIYSDDVEDMEVSSTTSMSSVLCRMLDSDFDDQFDADDFGTTIVNAIDLMHDQSENLDNSFVKGHDAQYKAKYERSVQSLTPDSEEFQIQVWPQISGVSTKLFPLGPDDWQPHSIDHQDTSLKDEVSVSQSDLKYPSKIKNSELITLEKIDDTILEKNVVVIQAISSQEGKAKSPCSTVRYSAEVNDTCHRNYSGENEVICQEERKHEDASIFLEGILVKREDTSAGPHKGKPQGKQILKTVVKGTALVGIMLFFLHLRSRRGGDKRDDANKPSSQILKSNGRKLSPQKGPSEGKVNGIYPAEKLKLGI